MQQLRVMLKRSRKKRTEITHLSDRKNFIERLYHNRGSKLRQKLSDWPDSGNVWNSLSSGRILACHLSSWQLQIFERFLQLKQQASRTPNSLCEPKRRTYTFEHLL
ncbi:hypothetical protein TNCV_180541 [Trichonephila clavipes]|nr:hypothetical protein TNCV_180541 [Trichonephila clavipes]